MSYLRICFHCFLGITLCFYVSQVRFSRVRNIPIILWWTPFIPTEDRYILCNNEKQECLVTNNRLYKNSSAFNAILFYGSHLSNHDFPLPRSNSVLWALYHEESPKNFPALLYLETQNIFNITATVSQHSDYPLTFQYLRDLSVLTDKKYYLDVKEKNTILNGIAPVLYIQSSCDTVSNRDMLVSELMKYVKIDSYGNCLNNRNFPERLTNLDPLEVYNGDFMGFISQYKFIISFENAICEDYISEKLWRPLIVSSIPIYLGSPNVEDWLPNEKSAILVKDFQDMKSLANYVNALNGNDTLYNTYLEHKIFGRISNTKLESHFESQREEHEILNFECFLCGKLNDYPGFQLKQFRTDSIFKCDEPQEDSFWRQTWNIAKYQSKVLNHKINQDKPFTEEEFETSLLYFWNNKSFS